VTAPRQTPSNQRTLRGFADKGREVFFSQKAKTQKKIRTTGSFIATYLNLVTKNQKEPHQRGRILTIKLQTSRSLDLTPTAYCPSKQSHRQSEPVGMSASCYSSKRSKQRAAAALLVNLPEGSLPIVTGLYRDATGTSECLRFRETSKRPRGENWGIIISELVE